MCMWLDHDVEHLVWDWVHSVTLLSSSKGDTLVIATGVILLIIGLLLGVGILETLGIIVLIVGVVLLLLGSTGRAVGGRRHYW